MRLYLRLPIHIANRTPNSTLISFVQRRAMSNRSYKDAIDLLNTLQSNALTLNAIRASGGQSNDLAIPEMIEYLERIGYKVRFSSIDKPRGSTCPSARRSKCSQRTSCDRNEGQRFYLCLRRLYPSSHQTRVENWCAVLDLYEPTAVDA